MTMEYATVTGRIVVPGTDDGIPGQLKATPLTANGVLAFPTEGTLTIGPAVADVAADGTLSQDGTPGIKIPTDVPEGTIWRLKFHPKGSGNLVEHLGDFEILEDTTTGELVPVEIMTITPSVALDIAAAEGHAAAAAASAAEAAEITGLTGEDAAVALLLGDPESATSLAATATLVPREVVQAAAQIVRLLKIDPEESGVAPFEMVTKAFANLGGKPDNVGTWIGYNASRYTQQAGEDGEDDLLGWHMGMESGYYDPNDESFGPEWYLNYTTPDGTTMPVATFRPLYVRLGEGDTNSSADKWAHVQVDIGTDPEGRFVVSAGNPATGVPLLRVDEVETRMSSPTVVADGATFAVRPAGAAANIAASLVVDSKGTSAAVASLRVNGSIAGLWVAADANTHYLADKADNPVIVLNYGASVAARNVDVRSGMKVQGRVHLGSQSGAPTIEEMSGRLGGVAPVFTASMGSNAVRGTISVGTGASGMAIGDNIKITLPAALDGNAHIQLTPANYDAATLRAFAYGVSDTEARIGFATAPAASQPSGTYKFNYLITG